jgi:hypothetical protein
MARKLKTYQTSLGFFDGPSPHVDEGRRRAPRDAEDDADPIGSCDHRRS